MRSALTRVSKDGPRASWFETALVLTMKCDKLTRRAKFRFRCRANHFYNSRRPVPTRGALRDRHERWVRDAVDAAASGAHLRAGRKRFRVRPSRVVLTPVAGAKLSALVSDGDK